MKPKLIIYHPPDLAADSDRTGRDWIAGPLDHKYTTIRVQWNEETWLDITPDIEGEPSIQIRSSLDIRIEPLVANTIRVYESAKP